MEKRERRVVVERRVGAGVSMVRWRAWVLCWVEGLW